MEETIMNPMDDPALSPADYAALMLERTDENGLLSIPKINFTDGLEDVDENAERVFEMAWDAEKLAELIETFETLYGNFGKIVEICLAADCDPLDSAAISALKVGELTNLWEKYVRGFEFRGLNPDAVDAIQKSLRAEFGEEELTTEEKTLCDQYYEAYIHAIEEEAAQRLGGGLMDEAVIFRSRRLCRLLTLHAPNVIINNEAQRLIEALALTRFAKREIRR